MFEYILERTQDGITKTDYVRYSNWISNWTIWRAFINVENKKETINGHQAHCLFTDNITKNIILQFIF